MEIDLPLKIASLYRVSGLIFLAKEWSTFKYFGQRAKKYDSDIYDVVLSVKKIDKIMSKKYRRFLRIYNTPKSYFN